MPRFAAVLPEGRLLLKNLETGETLTIRAEDGPVSIGTLTWTWVRPRGNDPRRSSRMRVPVR